MNNRQVFDRRQALKRALWVAAGGTIAYNELALGPSVQALLNRLVSSTAGRTLDARQLMAEAVQGGPATFRWRAAQALASTSQNNWAVVHIKVVNHVATPLVFRLGPIGSDPKQTTNSSDRTGQTINDNGTTRNINPLIFSNVSEASCRAHLARMGLGELSTIPLQAGNSSQTYGNTFRMNNWFAQILHDPGLSTNEATAMYRNPSNNFLGGSGANALTGTFDHSKVGLQAALGLGQTRGGNHSLANFKLRDNLPDLGFYVADKGILSSPLGIAAFMMGNEYDSAEGQVLKNAVLGGYAAGEEPAVNGVAVETHVNSIVQYASAPGTYIDSNLHRTFDTLVASDPVLRREMDRSKEQFRAEINNFITIQNLESTRIFSTEQQASAREFGSFQADGTGSVSSVGDNLANRQTAGAEFLAQVQYTLRCLKLPGMPVRNFSLFLNTGDLDGGFVDTGACGVESGARIKSLSYIEGMRQLAIGMNMLAKEIADGSANGRKTMVVVTAEGGRSNTMNDNVTSFAFVMGPKGDGVPTRLYADMAALNNDSSSQVTAPGSGGAHTYSAEYLLTPSGTGMVGTAVVGDLQAGVVRFLNAKLNAGVSLGELGNYIKID